MHNVDINIQNIRSSGYSICNTLSPLFYDDADGGVILNTRRIFSFSLFKSDHSSNTGTSGQLGNSSAWAEKYALTQYNGFQELLSNPMWADFGIVWFLHDTLMSDSNIQADGMTVADMAMNIFNKFKNRVAIYVYNCDEITQSPWFGTLVRYIPLITGGFEVVLFRDAHSSLPNKNTPYDRQWFDTWMSLSGDEFKQYWFYQMITYNPAHAGYNKVPFAGAWGARAASDDKNYDYPIISLELWNDYFFNPQQDWPVMVTDFDTKEQNVWLPAVNSRGIDERILFKISQDTDFMDNAYIVGITWVVYLFKPEINPRDFSIYYDKKIGTVGDSVFCLKKNSIQAASAYTYFPEARCILVYIAEIYGDGWQTRICDLWDIIEKLQTMQCSSRESLLLKQLAMLVPSKMHIWEQLFNVCASKSWCIQITNTLEEVINANGGNSLNYKNMCNLVGDYLRGGKLNYDQMINNKDLQDKQLHHITLPHDYPKKCLASVKSASNSRTNNLLNTFCHSLNTVLPFRQLSI